MRAISLPFDPIDFLGNITFGTPLRIRSERATVFITRESRFLEAHLRPTKEVLLALLEKYCATGVDEISDPKIFAYRHFLKWGRRLLWHVALVHCKSYKQI
jgi:hypothetical protein